MILATGCSHGPVLSPEEKGFGEPAAFAPIRVTAARTELRPVDRVVEVTGSLAPEETVTVSSGASGLVEKIHRDVGQAVSQGDLLVELDKRELQLQAERMRAELAQALARLGLDPGASAAPSSTAALRQAEAELADARSKYDIAVQLAAGGYIARERFEESQKQLHVRQAAVDLAHDEIRTQWASVQAIRVDLRLAEKRLSDATIVAPFDGVVQQRAVAPGQRVGENVALLTLMKAYPLRLNIDIPEVAASAVRVGAGLDFSTQAVPNRMFRAVVREINPSIDPRSRSLRVLARLPAHEAALKPGMFVQAEVALTEESQALLAPESAIASVAGLNKLFVLGEDKAVELHVALGVREDGWVEVLNTGLKPGDQVATSGLNRLVNGSSVATGANRQQR
jgi:RND family efflux transporter MFP subunit